MTDESTPWFMPPDPPIKNSALWSVLFGGESQFESWQGETSRPRRCLCSSRQTRERSGAMTRLLLLVVVAVCVFIPQALQAQGS